MEYDDQTLWKAEIRMVSGTGAETSEPLLLSVEAFQADQLKLLTRNGY